MSRVTPGGPGNFTSGGSGGTSSNFGSAFPAAGTAIGVKSGSNMTNLTADGSNNLNVNINASSATVPVSGTITANAGTGTFTVQGVAANGSAVSGNPVLVGGNDGTNARDISVDTSGNVNVNVKNATLAVTQSGSWTIVPNTLNSNGTITASNSVINANAIQNFESAFVPVTVHGSYTGVSFTIKVSEDNGTTFYNVPIYDTNNMRWLAPGATITPGSNVSNVYFVPVLPNGANTNVQVAATAWSTGTANIRVGGGSFSNVMPGSFMSQIMDAAGNARGANVTASNELLVNVNNATIAVTQSGNWSSRTQDGAGNNITSNSTTTTSNRGLDINILSILGTAPTTVGKIDVKGADGDVFVRQATASNLNATIIGTLTNNNAAPAGTNLGALTALANAAQPSLTEGDQTLLSVDLKGNQRSRIMDSAGNNRGMNVNANNAGLVAIDQTTIGTTNGVTPVPSKIGGTGWQFKQFGDGTVGTDWNGTKQQIVGSAATFGGYAMIFNPNTATSFIQIFNKASANVTLGTTVPDIVIPIPGVASASATGAAANNELIHGIPLTTGLTVAITTTAGGSTAPTNKCYGCILYN